MQNWPHGSTQKNPQNSAIFSENGHASIRCMVLHANPRILFPPPRQFRRGLSRFMHLHENYPIKRAGVAGRALRA
ncbi:hypothetical protein EW799_17980 [Salmonella enterica]|nr:hypothetical protein [Salmonella enterica]ECD2845994.1 hypothetical protein [Salmonella enterica subsp. enterica serovar Senftenberg]ECF4113023.1 hypothetical protein [Salmonella enterica subsp. enterica serovar Senftenberg]ECP1233999.1 hypothetical protein [Salmonella enterica]ECR0354846.1 hypothetical protein [Salmonella enterica]